MLKKAILWTLAAVVVFAVAGYAALQLAPLANIVRE
jgi:hypothetical protein